MTQVSRNISAKTLIRFAALIGAITTSIPAIAHPGFHADSFSFDMGFLHPLSGLDHLLALLAVGFWAAQQKRPAILALPILFPIVMALGAVVGMQQGGFIGMESSIATTVVVLGLFVAFSLKLPLMMSTTVISLFALLHGYAHGTELPQGVPAMSYVMGFMLGTVLLHIAGAMIGLLIQKKIASRAMRLIGAAISFAGVYSLAIA